MRCLLNVDWEMCISFAAASIVLLSAQTMNSWSMSVLTQSPLLTSRYVEQLERTRQSPL